MNHLQPKQVGDIGIFRYIDAESYDPHFTEIFSGIIIDVRWHDQRELDDEFCEEDLAPIYKVMCGDGKLRNFPHWEIFDPESVDSAWFAEEVAGEEE